MKRQASAPEQSGAVMGDHPRNGAVDADPPTHQGDRSGTRRLTPVEGVPMVSPAFASIEMTVPAAAEDPVPAYVRRAMAGDTRAFGELYQLHRRDVARLVARLMGPRGDVDDT